MTFADPVLRGALERRLGERAGETITQGDMAKMPGLYARDVSSLSGLEHAVNMTILLANRGTVSDLSPLSGLTAALTPLALDDQSIANLSPLAGHTALEYLNVSSNLLSDIAQSDDGYVTNLLATAPAAGGQTQVAMFNPGSNRALHGSLRLVNDGGVATVATISGVDDAGAPGGPVRVAVPAGESLQLAAAELEAGGA